MNEAFASFWTITEIRINLMIIFDIVGALLLGLLVGYERYFHGRAAGMRTFGIVCMASSALTVASGYPGAWFGGTEHYLASDPTRVIQGIVTGVGFIGAGVIMREGLNISGLSTAASIWSSSVIGVLMGLGLYLAAFALAAASVLCMLLIPRIEQLLPAHQSLSVTLRFSSDTIPDEQKLMALFDRCGYAISNDSLAISMFQKEIEWQLILTAERKNKSISFKQLSHELAYFDGMMNFSLTPARN